MGGRGAEAPVGGPDLCCEGTWSSDTSPRDRQAVIPMMCSGVSKLSPPKSQKTGKGQKQGNDSSGRTGLSQQLWFTDELSECLCGWQMSVVP